MLPLPLVQVRHIPNVPLPLPGRKMEGKKSEETLQIRLYAVDCPEVAHFGNPAQPFSAEAKEVRAGVSRLGGWVDLLMGYRAFHCPGRFIRPRSPAIRAADVFIDLCSEKNVNRAGKPGLRP